MDKDKMYFFTNSILNIIGEDIEFEFTKENIYAYIYEFNKMLIPYNVKIQEMNRHHIAYMKTNYNLDITKYNYPIELTYHILSILHEVGHKISIENHEFNFKEDSLQRVQYLMYINVYGDNYDVYRSIIGEKMGDYYSSILWNKYEKDILRFLKIYGKVLK